ncbi:sortase [Clavibacter sp. CT19]|uniref:sortase n=1 Tax=unclassified Clavibacter TaxID=2626594 RepID=UPI0022EADACA|nr:sortase [Clavibacter sp. CT19]MDA3803220.1 sortase [Clavibacter sp. CT19]
MLAKTLAGAFVALVITVSAPLAAQAENYVPTDSLLSCGGMSVTPAAVAPGEAVTISGAAGSFAAGETVALRLSATPGAPAAAGDPAVSVSAAADGSVIGSLTVPATATGTWRANEDAASGSHWCGLVSVVPGSTATASTGSLPITGGTLPTGLAVTAGGLLLAGAAAAGIAASRRRRAS